MGENVESSGESKNEYAQSLKTCSIIARPMASEKLTHKLLRIVRKASAKKGVRRGIREVVKSISKRQKGIVIIAGNVSPIDVYSHIPVLCEDSKIPYIYVPSKEDLGRASTTRRPTACVLLMESIVAPKFKKSYKAVFEKVMEVNERIIGV